MATKYSSCLLLLDVHAVHVCSGVAIWCCECNADLLLETRPVDDQQQLAHCVVDDAGHIFWCLSWFSLPLQYCATVSVVDANVYT